MERGLIIIITSNREPDELYKNGIQRSLFLPFIEKIKRQFHVIHLNSNIDYRMLTSSKLNSEIAPALVSKLNDEKKNEIISSAYFTKNSNDDFNSTRFETIYSQLTNGYIVQNTVLYSHGRCILIPAAASHIDVARFTFAELCGKPRGASDYYTIASSFHTVFLDEVPQMNLSLINEIRRFITMVDIFYDERITLIICADVAMNKLLDYEQGTINPDLYDSEFSPNSHISKASSDDSVKNTIDEIFAFERTLSRLHEMNKPEYFNSALHDDALEDRLALRFLRSLNVVDPIKVDCVTLEEESIKRMFKHYDQNDDGFIDMDELKIMLEEINLYKTGYRTLHSGIKFAMYENLSKSSGSKMISWEFFLEYFKQHGLNIVVN